jgi:hypothetical protein
MWFKLLGTTRRRACESWSLPTTMSTVCFYTFERALVSGKANKSQAKASVDLVESISDLYYEVVLAIVE